MHSSKTKHIHKGLQQFEKTALFRLILLIAFMILVAIIALTHSMNTELLGLLGLLLHVIKA